MMWTEERGPEAEQSPIGHSQIGCTSTRPIDDQQLLFHKQVVSNNGFCATRFQEFGEGGQQMYEQKDQVLYGQIG